MSEIIDCMAFIVRKTCWTLWKFTEFLGLRILDLLGLVFNILACLTIIRLPCMVRQFFDMEKMVEWRLLGFLQVLIFLMDIPVILMGLISIMLTFGLVLIPFSRKVKKKKVKCDYTSKSNGLYFGGFKLRGIVVGYFSRVMCDILCIPVGLICLCSWRCPILIHKIKKQKNWEDFGWRKVCVLQFLHLLLDIPCLLCGLLLMFTWRGPYLIYKINKLRKDDDFKWNEDRFLVFIQFFLLITDIFFFVLFLVTIVTWRGPILVNSMLQKDDESTRVKIAMNFGLVFVDIPCILCAFVVMVTLWRFPNFVRKCTKDEWELRKNCLKQFGLLVVDFAYLLLNILCIILSVVVMVTLWRLFPLLRDMKKYFKQRSEIGTSSHENETEDHKKNKKKLMNINSWKIRKAALKHFAFLFLDIPAICACFLILVTVVRLPKLLSKLVQAGDFYMEFSLIAFTHLVKLVVDLVFLILFIILMIMRPVQSWVHLLEDEEHRKNRLLLFYMQWVPDIIHKRHQMYREMEEVFSLSLKNQSSSFNVRLELSTINAEFLRDIQWVRDKVKKYELESEYDHFLHMVQFYEGKRAYKLERLYACELNYIRRADAAVHNENLSKFRNEMLLLESQVDKAIRAVQEFKVSKVPLYSEECGLRTRTRKETQMVLMKCLPSGRFLTTMLILVNLLLIYRGPALVCNLYHRWYDRRKIVFASLREYLKDFLALLIIVAVLLSVYRAPFLIMEISNDIISKRSWRAVRETVQRYPPKFAEDLVDFMMTLFSWKTVRFLFTSMLFGILMPADLFLTVTKFLFGNICIAAFITLFLYIVFFGSPFVLTFKVAPLLIEHGNGSMINICIGILGLCLILILILAAVLTFRNREDTFSIRPRAYDYVRFNWTNAHAIIFEVVEFLQLLALVFVVSEVPMYGGATLNQVSKYLLLDFATFEVKFWMTTTLFILWFFCCGLPVIFEHVLDTFPKGTFAKQVSWTLLVSLFANTLFVTIVESFLGFVACKYNVRCSENSTLNLKNVTKGNITSGINCPSSVLYDDVSIQCWDGPHLGVAVFGLYGLIWYSTTAIIFGTRYGDSDHPSLDLKFSPIYNIPINFAKALMIGVVVLGVANPNIVFGCLVVVNLAASVFTLLFKRLIGFNLSNSFVLVMWRIVSFVCGALAAVSAIVAKILNTPNSLVPLLIFVGGIGVVLVLAIVASVIRIVRRVLTPIEHKRKEFRTCLRQLEDRLVRNNHMVNSWTENRKRWRRLVRHVYEAQKDDGSQTANRTLELPAEILPPSPNEIRTHPPHLLGFNGLPVASTNDEIQNLPPPPPYQELFPHSMGPFDAALPPPPPYIAEGDPVEAIPMIYLPPQTPQTLEKPTQSSIDQDTRSVEEGNPITDCSVEVSLDENSVDVNFENEKEGSKTDLSKLPASQELPNDDTNSESVGQPVSQPGSINQSETQQHQIDSISFLETQLLPREKRTRESDPVLALECNGKNLLLVLEQHIHYSAFSFAFLTQLPMWRHSVESADWTLLIGCLRTLETNLIRGAFNSPSRVDVACADLYVPLLRLQPDPDHVPVPIFIPEPRDPEEIRALSDAERSRCLHDVGKLELHGDRWASIFDKVLPSKPIIRKWLWDSETHEFSMHFRRGTRGTVREVGPRGIQLAKGATISIPKVLKGRFPNSIEINFEKGFQPKGSKGPIGVTVTDLAILDLGEKVYITTQGKRLAFDKAMDCLHVVEWK